MNPHAETDVELVFCAYCAGEYDDAEPWTPTCCCCQRRACPECGEERGRYGATCQLEQIAADAYRIGAADEDEWVCDDCQVRPRN